MKKNKYNVLSLDVGLKRIGICLYIDGIPLPKEPIFRKNRHDASKQIDEIIKKKNINILLVGLPVGKKHNNVIMQKRIKHFISLLSFDGKIVFIDEYGSTSEASLLTIRKNSIREDSISAYVILKRWREFE